MSKRHSTLIRHGQKQKLKKRTIINNPKINNPNIIKKPKINNPRYHKETENK